LANDGLKYSPHQTLQICPPIFYHSMAFLNLNHYFGNWESYSYRQNDGRTGGRKTRASWEKQNEQTGGKSGDDTRPWIGGFVRLFGETEAQSLLEGRSATRGCRLKNLKAAPVVKQSFIHSCSTPT
jgi:hypothetical protein